MSSHLRLALVALMFTSVVLAWAEPAGTPPDPGPVSARDWGAGPDTIGRQACTGNAPVLVAAAAPSPVVEVEAIEEDQDEEALLTAEQEAWLKQRIDVQRIDLEDLYRAAEEEVTTGIMQMSLEECVQLALENNQDILLIEYEPLKSDADILAARGEFDPLWTGSGTYLRGTQSASAEIVAFGGISAIESYRTDWQTSLSGKLHWGSQYAVVFDLSKEETTFNRFKEEWHSGLTLSLTQPLLRGRGKSANLARIRQARNARCASDNQVELTVMNTVGEVVKAYWDLVGAIENVRVREESVENAKRLLDINQKRLDIGMLAAIEVLQSKAGVAARLSDLIASRSQVADRADILKQLLDLREGDVLATSRVIPTDRPSLAPARLDENESIALGMDHRPEVRSAQLDIEDAKLERRRAANGLLPQLDVLASVSQGGRDHYLREVFYDVRDRSDRAYTVGVQGSVPIGNRSARGVYHRAEIMRHQAERRLEKVKQDVMLQVRLALRGVRTSRTLVDSNRQTRYLQEANVEAEETRLELGATTSYRVLEIQEDLTLAQTQEVQALVNFEKALVELRLAEGTLLKSLGIEFQAPEPEPPVSFYRSIRTPELR